MPPLVTQFRVGGADKVSALNAGEEGCEYPAGEINTANSTVKPLNSREKLIVEPRRIVVNVADWPYYSLVWSCKSSNLGALKVTAPLASPTIMSINGRYARLCFTNG